MSTRFEESEAAARELDRQDPLARFRQEFDRPEDEIYLDGNSLGLLCRSAERALLEALEDWRSRAVGGWLDAQPRLV